MGEAMFDGGPLADQLLTKPAERNVADARVDSGAEPFEFVVGTLSSVGVAARRRALLLQRGLEKPHEELVDRNHPREHRIVRGSRVRAGDLMMMGMFGSEVGDGADRRAG